MAALWLNQGPVNDYDSFWHVQIGREILQRHTLTGLGEGWLAVPAPPWLTSQWLSEVVMALTVDAWGWGSLIPVRLLLLGAIVLIMGLTLVRGRLSVGSAVVMMVVTIALATAVQDRPQSLALLFLAVLAAVGQRLLQRRGRPPLLAVAAGSLLWAQLHGLWVLGPLAFGLIAAGLLLEDRSWRTPAVRDALACLGAAAAGVVNPHGLNSFLLPWRFHEATARISEWMPTTLGGIATVAWALLVVLTVVAWARTGRAVPAAELIWVLAWSASATQAYRNVIPSLILTAPVTVIAVQRAWPPGDRTPRPVNRAESRILGSLIALTLACGAAVLTVGAVEADPLAKIPGLRIARWFAEQREPLRVFNDYNATGALVGFSGGKARLVIDGRADMWGSKYIEDTIGVANLSPGWERRLTAFEPDAIVTYRNSPLGVLLTREGTWRIEMRDKDFELLLPVTSTR